MSDQANLNDGNRQGVVYSALTFGFYFFLASLITFPVIFNLNRVFIGAPESDAYEYARHMWWYGYALRNGYPVFAHPLLAYPDGLPGLWLWAIPLQSFPAWVLALVMPLPVAFNITALGRLALNGWAMAYLARRLLDGTHSERITDYPLPAAWVAGVVYMLYPAAQGQLFGAHVGILALWGIPLAADALLRLRQHTRPVDYVRAALFIVVSMLGSTMLLVFVVAPVVLTVLLLSRQDAFNPIQQPDNAGIWARLVFGIALAGVLAMPFVLPAIIEQLTSSAAVRPGGLITYSADLLAVMSPSFFAPHAPFWSSRVLGTNLVEGYGYVGLVAGVLAFMGIWQSRAVRVWLWMTLGAWLLSLGPLLKLYDVPLTLAVDDLNSYIPAPFALLNALPIFDIIRTPARFNLAVGFGVAVMAGYGVAGIIRFWYRANAKTGVPTMMWGVTAVLVMLIAADYQITWGGFPAVPANIPAEVAALRDDPTIEAIMTLPHDNLLAAKAGMYLQTAHHKPLLGGFVSRETPVRYAKREILQDSLSPALLDAAGVDVVIVFLEWNLALNAQIDAAFAPALYADERIAVYRVPEPSAPPSWTTTIDERGIHVFAPDETWAALSAPAASDSAIITLNEEALNIWTGERFNVPLTAGYHTIRLSPPTPCPPTAPHPALTCPQPTLHEATLRASTGFTLAYPVAFAGGVTLNNAGVDYGSDVVRVNLWWTFETPPAENMVRFVHVLDENGQQLAGDDAPLLTISRTHVERVTLPIPTDYSGDIRLYAGWYTYPDLARLAVLTEVEGQVNDWVLLDMGTTR